MLSIIIPIYNEEDNISNLYTRIVAASKKRDENYEVILVDDWSNDNSLTLMRNISSKDSRFKIISFSRNFWHQPAITAWIELSKWDAVIIMDGDLQDPPEELHKFLDKRREWYDVVYAIRTKRKENFIKKLAYKTFYKILKVISDIDIPLDSWDFCVMDRKVVDVLNKQMPEKSRFVRWLRAYAWFKQIWVKYERAAREAGEVKYTFKKLLKLALDGIFDFSTFPLRLATILWFTISIPSLFIGMFFLIHRIFWFEIFGFSPSDTPGLATLAVWMFFLGWIMLIMMWVMWEYIGRIYFEIKKRPFYIVDEIYEHKHTNKNMPNDAKNNI